MRQRDTTIPFIPPAVLRQMDAEHISKQSVLALFRSRPWEVQQEQLANGLYGPNTTWRRDKKYKSYAIGLTYTFDHATNHWVILSVRKFTAVRHFFPRVTLPKPATTVEPPPHQDRLFE